MVRDSSTAALAAAGLVVLALAGCIAGDDAGGAAATTGSGGSNGNQTQEPNATAVEAVLRILVEGNQSQPVNGTHPVPVGANVTFDATSSVGDNLTFSWDLGDGNTSANDTVVHSYAAAGNYSVSVTVTSSAGASDTATAALTASRAGPAPGEYLFTQSEEFSETLIVGTVAGDENGGVAGDGVDYVTFALSIAGADENGTPAVASSTTITLTSSNGDTFNDLDLYLLGPGGGVVDESTTESGNEAIAYDKPLAAGEYAIAVYFWLGAAADIDVAVTIDYVAA